MKKQTAVEYLESKIFGDEIFSLSKVFEQAKIIEKQQIINTWYDCKLSIIEKNPTDAEQYFNETFKK